jgi:hypothetical protein
LVVVGDGGEAEEVDGVPVWGLPAWVITWVEVVGDGGNEEEVDGVPGWVLLAGLITWVEGAGCTALEQPTKRVLNEPKITAVINIFFIYS